MSNISLRLPNSLHGKVKELADKDSVSMNQFITLALSEKVSALLTEEYLDARAKQGSVKKFRKALSKVKAVKPAEQDRL